MRFKQHVQKLNTEEGATLVELLAAIAILAVIVTAFLGFFVQAGSTNNRTDKINEATMLAQGEMEKVTIYAYENKDAETVIKDYFKDGNPRRTSAENGMTIETKIFESADSSTLHKVTVDVKEGEKSLAKMETRLRLENIPPKD